jgi:aminomethyltransferase
MYKKTALYDCHSNLNANLISFAGTLLPVRYSSEREEHMAVRQHAGIFDVSHMGEIWISGSSAFDFLQNILSNNINLLNNNQAQYSLILNHSAGIVDDIIIYKFSDQDYMLCVNAGNIEKAHNWIIKQASNINNLHITNNSDQWSQIAVQGPESFTVIKKIFPDLSLKRFHFTKKDFLGSSCIIAYTGYTGEKGVEIFVPNQEAPLLWQSLLEVGRRHSLKPCGLSARDSLRLEAGLLLHGSDMDETTSPLEVGLSFAVDLNKAEFIGKNALLTELQSGPKRELRAFRLCERGVPRHGAQVLSKNHKHIGVVSSGACPPTESFAIGFAFVTREARLEKDIFIAIRDKFYQAEMLKGHRFLKKTSKEADYE